MGDAIDELIEEILVDAYSEHEQLWSFRQTFEDDARFPFAGRVIGVDVEVTEVDFDGDERRGLVAVCPREGERHTVSLLDVTPAGPLPLETRQLLEPTGAGPAPTRSPSPNLSRSPSRGDTHGSRRSRPHLRQGRVPRPCHLRDVSGGPGGSARPPSPAIVNGVCNEARRSDVLKGCRGPCRR